MAGGIPQVTLNSGFSMPVIGMGTASELPPEGLTPVFIDAVRAGYRHFDTAALYGTEQPLGRAIAEAIELGLVQSRSELFITSKLWCSDAHQDLVQLAITKSLENLGLDYLDLYLIHWPVRTKKWDKITCPFPKEDLLPFDMRSTWAAMEECQNLGLVKSIGVSNFSCRKLSELMLHAKIPPAVNQVEMHISWQQEKLRHFCKDIGVHISAWSPLAGYGTWWGSPSVIENSVLKEIASARGKTIANVALRWLYEQGVSIIVKSYNKQRMKENLQIFDWGLSDEETDKISKLPQRKVFDGENFISPYGQNKTLEELWDGEI